MFFVSSILLGKDVMWTITRFFEGYFFRLDPRDARADADCYELVGDDDRIFGCMSLLEKGNINMPLELAILNQVDRFKLVIDAIDRVPTLGTDRTRDRRSDLARVGTSTTAEMALEANCGAGR